MGVSYSLHKVIVIPNRQDIFTFSQLPSPSLGEGLGVRDLLMEMTFLPFFPLPLQGSGY